MYATCNPKTKAELKRLVKEGPVPCHQPGPFGPEVKNGTHICEGPHYPESHKWYASVVVEDGAIVKVTS